MGHQRFIAMAPVARFGNVKGINGAIGVDHRKDIMIAVAITAGRDSVVALKQKFLSVDARPITRELIRPNAVEIHPLDIGMTGAASFDQLFFVRNSQITRSGRLGKLLLGF
jgi:hypothetical protein